MTAGAPPLAGALRFVRYAFRPNRLRYCGGDDNRTLFDYGIASATDAGLTGLLRKFTGALSYLQLIARANGIADPLDPRVVDAYWIGNQLRQVDGHGFVDDGAAGDWVSMHWGWVCEVLTDDEQQRLERYSRYHLRLANQTL